MTLAPGIIVAGKYRIVRALGEGGMGTVYEAAHQLTDGRVALKVMNEGLRSTEAAVARFVQEARAVARVSHPGITRIYDAGSDGDTLWMAMELLSGESLGEALTRGPLRLEDIDELFAQLLDVLEHVHRAGIVHRDLKPENVFLAQMPGAGTRVKLLDFGIAKLSDSTLGSAATQLGLAMGTLHYMAPEQARHAKTVDHRADIYAVGVILYECLAGMVPYEASTVGELVAKFYTEPPRRLELLPDDPARPYVALAQACLSIEPDARPADCRVVAERLREAAAIRNGTGRVVALAPSLTPQTDHTTFVSMLRPLATMSALLIGLWTVWALTRSGVPELAARDDRSHGRGAPVGAISRAAHTRGEPPLSVDDAPASVLPQAAPRFDIVPPQSEPAAAVESHAEPVTAVRRAQLKLALTRKRSELERCYTSVEGEAQRRRAVKLKVGLVIGSSGRVRRANAAGGGPATLHDCIEERLSHWRFPAAEKSSEQSFALAFEPSPRGPSPGQADDPLHFKADPY